MSKINIKLCDFKTIQTDGSQIIVCYGLKQVSGDIYECQEVVVPKTQHNQLTFDVVKEAIIADIDARTDAKILNGYPFTPDGQEEPIIVWLSDESQRNFSEAHRLQTVPVKFKLNEDAEKQPIYHTFETFEELDRFYLGGVAYIQQCLNEGWAEKDGIDWAPYEQALNPDHE
jgi:hypothetical protein